MNPTFEKRVRAFAIDTSGVALLAILAIPFSDVFGYVLVGLGFIGLYFVPYLFSSGQTFGKRIQKIRVVRSDGRPIAVWHVLLRDAFKLFLSIGTFGIYAIISFIFLSDHASRTIHDLIFRTRVIDLEPPQGRDNYIGKGESMRKRGF
ncbi:MAG: RDD family protein [Acholeplasmataceae bacterium]